MKTPAVVLLTACIATTFLTACSSERIIINKDGVDMVQYGQDERDCRQQAAGSKAANPLQEAKNCLKSRGYRVEN